MQSNTQLAGQRPQPEDYEAAATDLPKLGVFRSEARETSGRECFGKVTKVRDGIPIEFQALRFQGSYLCYPPGSVPESRDKALEDLRSALKALDSPPSEHGERELIAYQQLETRILPPVCIHENWIRDDTDEAYDEKNEIFVVGALINYKAHADETLPADKRLFPKPTLPTGAYTKLRDPACLLDHEVEIAYIALEDIPLKPLPEADDLWPKLAFFAVNDVSDREPIILDPERGFTRGKAHPGYLPSGPWLISGEHLRPKTNEGGEDSLLLKLWTLEASAVDSDWVQRQEATSDQMILGPRGILEELAKRDPDGEPCQSKQVVCSMPDLGGKEREMIRGKTLPAGSIVLTGTPGGTAIRAPGQFQKLIYGLRGLKHGGFNEENGRKAFLEDQRNDRAELGYLEPGDSVSQVIGQLGRQEWQVERTDPTAGTGEAECSREDPVVALRGGSQG